MVLIVLISKYNPTISKIILLNFPDEYQTTQYKTDEDTNARGNV